ncbi:hypothetical protein [Sporosarcina luteola]|uniref:hypothetical protein n=1 Tax=Sporosarcina luteola TaxID=582850 RepID=UPI00203F79C6|nr:hypothetical protein [Sporosarcina luteola]MCM3712370.1 hypothetical protein [Sporosarcina luteola]
MAEAIFMFILFVPIGVLTFLAPREMMLLGKRWQYDSEPEFSKEAILYTKITSAFVVGVFTLILVISIINAFR